VATIAGSVANNVGLSRRQLQIIPVENCADCWFARFRLQAATGTGLVRLASTLEPARAGKFQVPKQCAEYHGMLVFMPKCLSTVRTLIPSRQVSRHLLLNDLFLQASQ
jgi:hypothetical protein